MLEAELTAVANRVAPPTRPDLAERVLERLDQPAPGRPRLAVTAAVVAALVGALGLSPQVRAAAVDLLDRVGIVLSDDEPDASPTPDRPLPGTTVSELDQAGSRASFPLAVPTTLGEPERVTVADGGRVVSMAWRDGSVVLDQFEGRLGPVFTKEVGGVDVVPVDLAGLPGWWIAGPHDLRYVDRDGDVVEATARLAGRTLIWQNDAGVSYRLEGADLRRRDAVTLARSMTGTS